MKRTCSGLQNTLRKVTHVIFDLDGLLLDTERMFFETARDLVRQYGKEYTWEVRRQVMGMLGIDSARRTVEILDLPISAEEFRHLHAGAYMKHLARAPLMPGAVRLVTHLHDHRVPIAIATSSSDESYSVKAGAHRSFFNLFQHVVRGGSDSAVKQGKPAPDIFQVCASRFAVKPCSPQDVLVFEDAPNGVTAGRAAGMQVVMVPDRETDSKLCEHATLVIESLEEFQPQLFGLPPYNNGPPPPPVVDENNNDNKTCKR